MVTPVRYTPQKQQERISRRQLCERLDEFGWIATPPDEDLGEDFIVHIYLQGRATGVTFHLQLKSVTNLIERRKGDYLVYDFAVKDLKHWETFSLPVVLMVWDVKLREGRWALIDEVIEDLDRRQSKWREKKPKSKKSEPKIRVHIPWNNTTDDVGLVKLKQDIGHRLYPLISKNKTLEIQVEAKFSNTEEGRTAFQAFNRMIKEGEPVTLTGEFIQKLDFSEWWRLWFGEFDSNKATISLGPSAFSSIILVNIDMISINGKIATIPTIELKAIKDGTEIIQLSNEHQHSPLHFLFKVSKLVTLNKGTVSITENYPGHHIGETRNVQRFLDAIASGGELRLIPLDNNKLPQIISVFPNEKLAPDPRYLKLLDKLCVIQDKVGCFIQIPDEGLTDQDIPVINELMGIIENGKTVIKPKQIMGECKREDLDLILDIHRHKKPCHFTISSLESWVELFGSKILIGRVTQHITCTVEMSVTELENAIAKLKTNEYLNLQFIDVEIIEIFPDWFIREAQRLSQLLAEKFEVETVYLFGSLVWSDIHTPETDIDLAVGGLPEEQFLEAVSYLERESKFPIDLVDLDKISEHLRQRILTEGKILHEREPVAAFG